MQQIQTLSGLYYNYMAQPKPTYEYKVEIKGEEGRASGIHASEASGCMRRLVYSIMDQERKVDPATTDTNMKMRFSIGHAVHAMLQNDWHRIAEASNGRMAFEDEVPINPEVSEVAKEYNIYSSSDGIITLFDTDDTPRIRMGFEIKTESPGGFEKLKEPRPYHIEQAHVYMACLDLPLMWFLYYNKGNSNITTSFTPWVIRFNRNLWEQMELRFVKALHLAETGDLPDREEGMPCRWCPFSYTCQPQTLNRNKPTVISPGLRRR
jgi:hypothetical protein